MRSARVAIATVALLLVLVPFVLLGIAWLYEQSIVRRHANDLGRVSARAAMIPFSEWAELGRREDVWLRRVLEDGTVEDTGTASGALTSSAIGGAAERLFELAGGGHPSETLAAVDGAPHPEELSAAREGSPAVHQRESGSGQTLVVSLARALPDGSVVLAVRGSHRGIRQLLLARRQLVKLVLYQLVFAVASVLLLSRWLVKPLERLTARALDYPANDVADPELLGRRDEVGQLARAFTGLTRSLEARRQATVDLAADIAHELKNPLAAISAASELVATTADATPGKRAQMHETIVGAVERLKRTTDALLELVRLESALVDAPRDALEYGAWLDALLDSYRSDPQHEGWRFELEAGPGLGTVHVAGEAWASMLRNLLDNARVQPSEQRRVRVRARREAGRVVTEVTDFGPGVSEGNREKVFERFFTARPEGVERGTGLGLAIVRAVAEAHGGAAELAPAVPGEGATFRVVAPAATPPPHGVPGQSPRPPG